MILLDPHLESSAAADAPTRVSAKGKSAPDSKSDPKTTPRDIRLPAARTLSRFLVEAQQAVRLNGQVTVLLTTDAAIRKLNRQFRGKNEATDVLSFPAEGPVRGSDAEKIAGDLAISVTTALSQAAEQGHSLSTEIKVLVLHGLLHLAGYDHEIDEGRMARRERLLRTNLKLPQGLIERSNASKKQALKGHAFRHAAKSPEKIRASAPDGMQPARKALPRGLKPKNASNAQSARLKSSSFKAATTPISAPKAKQR